MMIDSVEDLSPSMAAVLTPKGREVFINAYNAVIEDGCTEDEALIAGFGALRSQLKQTENGRWISKGVVDVVKSSDDEMRAWGWLYVTNDEQGNQVIDHSGEYIKAEDLEPAVYDYMLFSRTGGDNHKEMNVATIIESMFVSPEKLDAMGLSKDGARTGWWVGFQVHDEETWRRVKSGEYKMFSIGGTASGPSEEETV